MHISTDKNRIEIFLLAAILLFPWMFLVFQGLYIAELGYWLVSYENFFENPEVAQTVFYSWLTAFLGGLVDSIAGSLGVISFKIANVFIIYITLYTAYQLLSSFTSKTNLLFFLLIAELFINISTYTYINYYSLPALLFLLSALFLYKGTAQNKKSFLFLAGIILGLNLFARFPNVLGLGLLLAIIYYDLAKGKLQYKYTLTRVALPLTGFFVAIVSVLLFMDAIGHYDLYIERIAELFGKFSNASSDHSGTSLIHKVIAGHSVALRYGFFLFLFLFFLLVSGKYWIEIKVLNKIIALLLIVFMVVALMKLSQVTSSNYHQTYIGVVGFIYGSLLWIAYSNFKKNPNLGVIALMSFLIIEITPMGSATGLHQSIYGMYLAIPVIFIYVFTRNGVKNRYFEISEHTVKYLGTLVGTAIIIYAMVVMNFYRVTGGGIERWSMLTNVDHPLLRGNYMTKERADTLQELVIAMDRYSKGLSYILTYEEISTINYLSRLKPYLNNTYPFFMPVDKLKKDLRYESKRKTLPMVVRATTVVTQSGWPVNAKKIDKTAGPSKYIEIRAVFDDFLQTNNYIIVWNNDDFEILLPKHKANIQ